ncbi:benzoate-CoA ligase family protein [Mesorhizobium sp. B2-5-7]|uniref:benzoate-CoA ligase family protein n=1 Tax=Mesorhizobium sp. B2-5-7 TaxID=2589923 RepID=UPI001125D8EB|nr:benzoate-CoA ligase family protein [Mesorhizobium sp. B2-5-7]TPK10128.1 benzoate-CoA ligase family protein [Mesorhizobium sp. B2-5-7]
MARLANVEILGAGPAGLYTAILMRRFMPHVKLRVTEQNPSGATFGFGVVFSDQALDFLKASDPAIYDLITPHMERWKNMTLNLPKGNVTLDGVGFSAIGRLEIIEILRRQAQSMGVELRFSHQVMTLDELDAELIVGADGLNSLIRRSSETEFGTNLEHFTNHFAWFGTNRPFETLTQTFIDAELGALNAHHYRFEKNRSTFIVECDDATFQRYGFASKSEQESAQMCERLFSEVLEGAQLVTNKSMWRQFPKLWCEKWVAGRHVLLGDAAHTAHFSIGSGTRLALEDAIALVDKLSTIDDVDEALAAYQAERPPIAKKIVNAANTSARWYEDFASKMELPPLDFAFDYMSRSGRMDLDRMRRLAPEFVARYEREKAATPAAIIDPVGDGTSGAEEIGFRKADHPNCSSFLWDNLERNPEKLAVIGPAGSRTYRELIAEAARWGNAFKAAGLAQGDRIPFFLDDTPSFPEAFFGAVRAGFVPVLLNIQTRPDVLNFFLKDTSATIAVCEAAFATMFADQAVEGSLLKQTVIVNGECDGPGLIRSDAFLAGHSETLECTPTTPDDMAFWMYSSGSTGRPKGIVHLHHDMAYSQQTFGARVLDLQVDDIGFSVPKAYFAYGFGNSLLFPFAVGATSLLLAGQPRPEAVLDAVEKYRPTVIFGLPTLYTALVHSKEVEKRDLSSLRLSMSAAEILSQEVYTSWKQLTGHGPTEGLGSTEMLHIYLSNKKDDHRIGSAGCRVPGYEIRLETPDGQPAQPGEEGLMFVRGHSSTPCYWNRPDKTRETMRGDWIYTGDRFIETDGYYYFQGRADDLIKVSGQWVWPLEVERCLSEHPDVQECAVMAHKLPDQRMTLRAVVQLRSGLAAGDTRSRELADFVKARLQPHKYPRIIEYVREIPKTGTGKIDRQALLQDASAA